MRPFVRASLVLAGTTVLYAAANRFAASFRITDELSVLYPPTGVGVAATFLFGPWAAAGAALGTFLTRWTPNLAAEVLYALVNAMEALVPWVAFRELSRRGTFRRRDLELRTARGRLAFFLTGVAANTALSALLGAVVGHTVGSSAGVVEAVRGIVTWWVGNGTAALLLGWPLVEVGQALRRERRRVRARDHHAALVASLRAPSRVSAPARKLVLGIVGAWAIVTAALLASGITVPAAGTFFSLPIMVAAYLFGFRGGLIAGSILGWTVVGWALSGGLRDPDAILATQVAAFDRAGLGILTGGLFEANRRMIRQMKTRYAALRQDLNYVAGVLTAAVESKDPYTEGHMQRVSLYSVRIARRLGLPEEDIESLRLSALLHDIGKIGVPDHILFKPEALHGDELKTMRSHVEIGAKIAANCSILKVAEPVIRHHQERYDGRTEGAFCGYPDGLKGEEIPLWARIVAVADAYDTMTTNRPYRKALGRARAIQILTEERGHHFDPSVVDAFLSDLEERRGRKASSVFSIAALVGRASPAGARTESSAEVPAGASRPGGGAPPPNAADAIRATRRLGKS